MKKITSFDKTNLDEVRKYMESKFKEMEQETGINFKMGPITYYDTMFTSTLTSTIANGKSEWDLKREEFEKHCYKFDIPKESFGKIFNFKGENVQIVGIKKYAEKYPLIGYKIKGGGEYLYSARFAKGELINPDEVI